MCHRLLFHLFFKVSTTIPIPTSQVCLRLNYKLNWNLTCPLSHTTFFSSHSCPSYWCLFLQSFIQPCGISHTVEFDSSLICFCCYGPNSGCHLNLEGVSCIVQSNQAVAAQLLHATTRERWNSLFPCVCLPLSLSFISIPSPLHLSSTCQKKK